MSYDIIARVGLARFLECRQCEEVQLELSCQYGIEIPVRTISHLAHKFIAYFQVVHQESIQLLRKAMQQRGGYILHIDGTCEDGSRVLFVCLDSLSGQVLESCKISSENAEEVEQVLRKVRQDWGCPLAVVHDLRKSLMNATAKVFPANPQFICHFHFAADVGKDILSPHVNLLRNLFRRTKVKPKLRALCRSLKKYVAAGDSDEHILSSILEMHSAMDLRRLSTPESIKGTVHALASWILASSHNGDGYGFPFDVSYLTFYNRIIEVDNLLHKVSKDWSVKKQGPLGTLKRLKDILDIVMVDDHTEFCTIVTELRRDQKIFEQLRNALKICPKGGTQRRNDEGTLNLLSSSRHKVVLAELRASLKKKFRRGSAPRKACNIVLDHLDKYWNYLFGHVLKKRPETIVVPRTNNIEESLFRTVKRQCRRLHGRGHVCRDIDDMCEAAPLVLNLKNDSYCDIVYGGTSFQCIAERFSEVDPVDPARLLKNWRQDKMSVRLPRKFERLTSLPQRLVRFIGIAFKELQK
ncbi:MAG: hypothetical protein QGG09_03540 [Pirellulaceae bacterium]|jgi:hypothetical protein|nr:hypothetical protein [Pirellulaceae bacterium]